MSKASKILIIEKDDVNRELFKELFGTEYDLYLAGNVPETLKILNGNKNDLDLIIIACKSFSEDGLKNLQVVNTSLGKLEIPKYILTESLEENDEIEFYKNGANEVILKPFSGQVFKARINRLMEYRAVTIHAIEEERMVMAETENKSKVAYQLLDEILAFAARVAEFRNVDKNDHVDNVRQITKVLLSTYKIMYPDAGLTNERIETIVRASVLHDIGKCNVPEELILKPGRLSIDEYEVVKSHTSKGCEIISLIPGIKEEGLFQDAYDICRYHHERADGQGYPEGLKGEEIPLSAQVVGLADSYEVLTSDRVYKKAYTRENAFNMIMDGNCGAFDEKLLKVFQSARDTIEKIGVNHQ